MKHYIEPREGTPIQSKMQLPEKLRELRVNSGYTQQQVADAIQTTLRQYQRFEKGEQKPGFDNLIRLADCFQVSLDFLAGRSERRTVSP